MVYLKFVARNSYNVKLVPGTICNGRCFFANSNNSPMRACARNKLSCDVVLLPRLPVVEFLFRGLHREPSLRDIIRLTSNWKGYRSFFTMPGNPTVEGKWTKQVNLEVIDNHNYDISIKEVSHMLVNLKWMDDHWIHVYQATLRPGFRTMYHRSFQSTPSIAYTA